MRTSPFFVASFAGLALAAPQISIADSRRSSVIDVPSPTFVDRRASVVSVSSVSTSATSADRRASAAPISSTAADRQASVSPSSRRASVAVTTSSSRATASASSSSSSPSHPQPTSSTLPPLEDETTKVAHFDCGSDSPEKTASFKSLLAQLNSPSTTPGGSPGAKKRFFATNPTTAIVIDTYFHVITTSAQSGTITSKHMADQLSALNKAYAPWGISFNLRTTTFTTNDAWATQNDPATDLAMKSALRRGTYSTLNLYFQTSSPGSVLGTCTLPTDLGDPSSPPPAAVYVTDGCVISTSTLPLSPTPSYGYSLGMTAVHETGHWLGLLHTFEGYSCEGPGDFVDDTPVQSTATDGCPRKPVKDSCPGQGGVDMVGNFMDYSTDGCYTGFTKGQGERMKVVWGAFRKGR